MRTETRTVRVGEFLGPVDWDFDFGVDDERVRRLRDIEAGIARGETWQATTDGGWPRFGWGEVLAVGMYDGWPYWSPTPSVLISGHFGGEWSSWRAVTDARVQEGTEK